MIDNMDELKKSAELALKWKHGCETPRWVKCAVCEFNPDPQLILDMLKRIVWDEDNGLEISAQHAGAKLIAESLYKSLEQTSAKNYLEVSFFHPEEGYIVVTLQRTNGKTPHQLLEEKERELEKLRGSINA